MSRRSRVVAGVAAATLGILLLAPWGQSEPNINTGSYTELKDGILPPSYYLDSQGNTDERNNIFQDAINARLDEAEALKKWQLCKAELHAGAMVFRAIATAMQQYPLNLPWNEPVEPGEIKHFLSKAKIYEKAARIAAEEDIACTGPATAKRPAALKLQTSTGRELVVMDYDVLRGAGGTVEYSVFVGLCPEKVRELMESLQMRPVSKKQEGTKTLTQQGKAIGLARFQAKLEMLEAAHVTC